MWYVHIYLHNENETILQYFPWKSGKVKRLRPFCSPTLETNENTYHPKPSQMERNLNLMAKHCHKQLWYLSFPLVALFEY